MRFFFYGTLQHGSDNVLARDVHSLLVPAGAATITGSLFAIPDLLGWYPGFLPGSGEVHGVVYEAGAQFGLDDLAQMDDYEDYIPARPDGSLYVRRAVALVAGGMAQAYVWNAKLPDGARQIAHGDFRRWLAEQGLQAYRGLGDK